MNRRLTLCTCTMFAWSFTSKWVLYWWCNNFQSRKCAHVPRKIIQKTVANSFSIIWNPSLRKHLRHACIHMHTGVCINAQTEDTRSISSDSHFPPSQTAGVWLHPGCCGFSRPLRDSAPSEEKDTARKMFHHYHPVISEEAVNIHITILPLFCTNIVQMSPWAM